MHKGWEYHIGHWKGQFRYFCMFLLCLFEHKVYCIVHYYFLQQCTAYAKNSSLPVLLTALLVCYQAKLTPICEHLSLSFTPSRVLMKFCFAWIPFNNFPLWCLLELIHWIVASVFCIDSFLNCQMPQRNSLHFWDLDVLCCLLVSKYVIVSVLQMTANKFMYF